MIAGDRYHRGGNDSDGGAARGEGQPGVGGPEPGVVGADHGLAQPDSVAPVDAGDPDHVTVAVTVAAAAVLTVAAAVVDGGQPDTARGAGLEVYGDSAYGSGEARAAYARAGMTP